MKPTIMKKIIIFIILIVLFLAGCKKNIDSIESIQPKILSMADSELLSNYVNPLEISVPNLDFESTQELTSEELYRLFKYLS